MYGAEIRWFQQKTENNLDVHCTGMFIAGPQESPNTPHLLSLLVLHPGQTIHGTLYIPTKALRSPQYNRKCSPENIVKYEKLDAQSILK